MDVFKFQIGDIVLVKTAIADAEMKLPFPKECRVMPKPLMILERMLQECPGGVQKLYLASAGGARGKFNEIELVSIRDFDVEKFMQAWHNADSD